MKESRHAPSPKTRQEQLEQWICRQHQQQELPPEQGIEPDCAPVAYALPTKQQTQPVHPYGHRQYDAIINKMRTASKQTTQVQPWHG